MNCADKEKLEKLLEEIDSTEYDHIILVPKNTVCDDDNPYAYLFQCTIISRCSNRFNDVLNHLKDSIKYLL